MIRRTDPRSHKPKGFLRIGDRHFALAVRHTVFQHDAGNTDLIEPW